MQLVSYRFAFYAVALLVLSCIPLLQGYTGTELQKVFEIKSLVFFLGVIAATIANTTGVGGGIVFVPAFTLFQVDPIIALGTSFAIQSFGMSSGAVNWIARLEATHGLDNPLRKYRSWISWGIMISCTSTALGQYIIPPSPHILHLVFSGFSLTISGLLFWTISRPRKTRSTDLKYTAPSAVSGVILCILGGFITSWLSIGIGEIVAFYLIFQGVNARHAIAVAVIFSAANALVGSVYYIQQGPLIDLDLLFFASFGAMIGGALSPALATLLSEITLKKYAATWIMITAAAYFVLGAIHLG
ncbi:hypothetical protein BTA51_14675 [Hahella sp. CCB-MM4]|uniref:sulfite exporter TauE/SafE family protein n=1 Tax=Hahella sp. (strain CCB-MM4) TaxID=1926491 RepID=UPI000BC6418D|nr:sulfite exporter TauE/SafE family protein [Hahella sp. CCB-MM4]OZG72763.1 hypothetical protein BTA51_14675 [Hahella sp. CCB-MM4]